MPWSDAFSSLPPSARVIIAVAVIVPAVAAVAYVALVVAPTVPAIVEAIKQGRSATLVPLGIGEYEPPSVKECKFVIENTNDSLHSLQANFDKTIDLLKSEQSILQDAMNKRAEFLQLSSEKTSAMHFDAGSIEERLNNDVQTHLDIRDDTVDNLKGRLEQAINYLNRIRDYCLH
jgi:hypothetical protein